MELPKCSNGTLELESGTYEAPENRGMLVGDWEVGEVHGRDVSEGSVDG